MKKLNYTYFWSEIKSYKKNINKKYYYLIMSLLLLTIISLKTDIWYSVEHYKAPQEPKIDYTMEISTSTIQFIKSKEGFSSVAYKDGNRHSIGYGTKAREGQTITKEQAEIEMKKHIKKDMEHIDKKAKVGWNILNEKQQTALLSLSYNIGAEKVASLVRKNIDIPLTEKDFTQYWCAGNKCIQGLENRRLEEWNYYKDY